MFRPVVAIIRSLSIDTLKLGGPVMGKPWQDHQVLQLFTWFSYFWFFDFLGFWSYMTTTLG